jgi:hypothetical protein
MSILKRLLGKQLNIVVSRVKPKTGPSTLDEAIDILKQELSPETLRVMREEPQSEMARYHHNLGMRIRNRWGLWGKSPLRDHFVGLGLEHADDMSSLILTSLRRHLRGEPLRVEEQVKKHQEYWSSMKTETKGFAL